MSNDSRPPPPREHDYTNPALTTANMLFALADDGAKWAKAFCQFAKKQGHDLDEEWVCGWFCNAIETSNDWRNRHRATPGQG